MDLDTIRQTLKEKQEARERVGAEADGLRAQLATISKAARAAEVLAEEASLLAVIDPSPAMKEAEAKAKATLVSAFEQETTLRDRLPLLTRALEVLDDEIVALEAKLPHAADEKVRAALNAQLPEIDEQLVQVTARVYARLRAHGGLPLDFPSMLADRLHQPGMRDRIFDAAAQVRSDITKEVQP